LGEERLPPGGHEPPGVQVFRMDGPQPQGGWPAPFGPVRVSSKFRT
jgi:hypothetical protein